jgi:MerR family transcriptional regulator, heat shock protein HspR
MSDPGRADPDTARPLAPPAVRFPTDHEPLYTVGQVADLLGVQPAFLRRLEAHDAISPSRSSGGQRRYSRREVEHVAAISALMSDGMTLMGATRIIALQAEVDELRRRLAAYEATESPLSRRP